MKQSDIRYNAYIEILKRELMPAMGCTEPIALAFCAAKAKAVLGELPELVFVEASGNIIKNVKSVVVPNTNGKKGIAAAAAIGIVAGNPERNLEVIANVSAEQKNQLAQYLECVSFQLKPIFTEHILDIAVTVRKGDSYAKVRIVDEHTNIILIEKNGEILLSPELYENENKKKTVERSEEIQLSVESIFDFALTVDLRDINKVLILQKTYNQAIAQEGLSGNYGANIGRTILKNSEGTLRSRAIAKTAAASDARMNGCELPVVINSGSGNQGITASIPVLEYADALGASEEDSMRALIVSNLITLHLKSGIGRLSAYCGAVSAGAGAGAGIAFLMTRDLDFVSHTIINTLAITSGIVCDGAKSSCAAKIATAVDAGLRGLEMYKDGQQFFGGDGLVDSDIEKTIMNIGILGKEGMKDTDKTIIKIMTNS